MKANVTVLKCLSVEGLETLPAGTKMRTSHHRSHRGQRHRKAKRLTIFLERVRKGRRQWDQHWNCLIGNAGNTAEVQGGVHMGFPMHINATLNWIEQLWRLALLQSLHINQSIPSQPAIPCHSMPLRRQTYEVFGKMLPICLSDVILTFPLHSNFLCILVCEKVLNENFLNSL